MCKQQGFGIPEFIGVLLAVCAGLFLGGSLFIGIHFIAKFW